MEPFPPIELKDAFLGPQVEINELPTQNPSTLRRANTVAPGTIKRNLELKAARERTATGVRAKDSHELLGKLQRSQTHRPLVPRPPGRKAGHFTVRSVGQNGKIFLRYTHTQSNISLYRCVTYAHLLSDQLPIHPKAHSLLPSL